MLTYLDTSSLVKLYVEEPDSDNVKKLVDDSHSVATSIVAYAEARSAFSRKYQEKAFSSSQYKKLKKSFDDDWDHYLIVTVSNEIARHAGDLTEKHQLRGFDAIHLASAIALKKELSAPILFSCADKKLQGASKHEGFQQPF